MQQFISYFTRNFLIRPNGTVATKSGHHAVSIEDVLEKYAAALAAVCQPCNVTMAQIAAYVQQNTPKVFKQEFVLQEFILSYLRGHADPSKPGCIWRIGPGWKTIERMQNGIPVSSDITELQQAIRAEAIRLGYGKNAKYDDIKVLLADLSVSKSAEYIERIAKSIAYDPACIPVADQALDALHEFWGIKQSKEVHRTIIKHWVWQVKRKLLGLPTVWSIWPNYYGGTGIGKTQYLTDFTKPFSDYAMTTTISKLLDEERQMMKLTNAYAINLDELSINNRETQYADKESTLGRDQQATLKALLTQTKTTTRLLGGQKQTTRRLTFSCISSANEHLYDIIYDEKTMRRYYEFECTAEKVEDFSPLEQVKEHILDIWRCVDPAVEEGYWNPSCPVWKTVADEQAKYYPTNTTTARWIVEQNVTACEREERDNIQELYDDYKTYCKERGHIAKSQTKWIVDVRHLVPGCVGEDSHVYIHMKPTDKE